MKIIFLIGIIVSAALILVLRGLLIVSKNARRHEEKLLKQESCIYKDNN